MNNLQIFRNSEFGELGILIVSEKEYFPATECAVMLGYSNPHDAINRHAKGVVKHEVLTGGGKQEINFIPEGDLYRLIVKSKLPSAEKFERWVFDDVLPTIRKHGAYMTQQKIEEALLNPDVLIQLATTLKEEKMKNLHLQAENSHLKVSNQIMQPKADYFDELVDRNLLTNFRETAKALKVKESEFIGFLIERKYVFRDKKGKLMPYADKNNGLFDLKECINEKTKWAGVQTLITPKGRETFRLLIGGLDAN